MNFIELVDEAMPEELGRMFFDLDAIKNFQIVDVDGVRGMRLSFDGAIDTDFEPITNQDFITRVLAYFGVWL